MFYNYCNYWEGGGFDEKVVEIKVNVVVIWVNDYVVNKRCWEIFISDV